MAEKHTSVFENGLIWFGAGVSIAEILTGTYFAPLGFFRGIFAIIIGIKNLGKVNTVAMPLSWLPLISDYTREADKPVKATAVSTAVCTVSLISCSLPPP